MKALKLIFILLVVLVVIAAGIYLYPKRTTAVLKLNTGDEFIIMLVSNRTTGYEWQIDRPIDGNKVEQKSLVYVPDKTGLAGSGGKEEWKFRALKVGRSQISFKYVRPREKGVKPAEKKVFDVDIKKP